MVSRPEDSLLLDPLGFACQSTHLSDIITSQTVRLAKRVSVFALVRERLNVVHPVHLRAAHALRSCVRIEWDAARSSSKSCF